MAKNKKVDIQHNLDYYLQIYEQVNETQRYEGAGIWSRFNIIISLNIILFGLLTLIASQNSGITKLLFIIVSLSGGLFSLWAMYVLRRLWLWHSHWKATLQNIESLFPDQFPKPFSSRPQKLKKNSAWYQSWLLSYTQPFILILFLMWVVLFVLSINGVIFIHTDSGNKTGTIEFPVED